MDCSLEGDFPGKSTGVGCHCLLRVTVYKVAKSQTRPERPCAHRHDFFACGSSAPVRVEREDGTAAWLAEILAAPSVQGHGMPLPQELWSSQSLSRACCSWRPEGLFGQSFSVAPPIQSLRGLPCLGSLSCSSGQAHRGAPWLGSYSVDRCVTRLMGQPCCCSAADAGCWRVG